MSSFLSPFSFIHESFNAVKYGRKSRRYHLSLFFFAFLFLPLPLDFLGVDRLSLLLSSLSPFYDVTFA